MTMAVRLRMSFSVASWMSVSDWESSARGGLVEDEDARVLEQDAGDGDALALAAGERDAALADAGVVAVLEAGG